MDSDAAAYISAVQTADAVGLPPMIKDSIDELVIGCKEDESLNTGVSNWLAIKEACLFFGPTTINGGFVPIRGAQPALNVSGVFSDYFDHDTARGISYKTLASARYLLSARTTGDDPQNNRHLAVYITTADTGSTESARYAGNNATVGGTHLRKSRPTQITARCSSSGLHTSTLNPTPTGLFAVSRNSATEYQMRHQRVTYVIADDSATTTASQKYGILSNGNGLEKTDAKVGWYSIGEAIDMEKLELRLSRLFKTLASSSKPQIYSPHLMGYAG